jgi:SAM-dependent methyltransferase
MTNSLQSSHFKIAKNRYNENLLFHLPKHTQEEINLMLRILKKRNITSVIDFGSGNGRLTFPLLLNKISVIAVDISKESLQIVRSIAKRKGIQHLSTSDHIPSNKTDAFVGCDILHHIDLDIYLKMMQGRLKNRGILLFSEPNILNVAWVLFITFLLDWRIEWRILFCNYFSLTKKLRENKFTDIYIYGVGILPPPLLNWAPLLQRINYFLGDLPILKLFAYRFIIVAQA